MSTWNEQFGALELVREKNRLGRGSNLGSQGGNLSLWGPERFFSVVGIAIDIPIIRKSQILGLAQHRSAVQPALGNVVLLRPLLFEPIPIDEMGPYESN